MENTILHPAEQICRVMARIYENDLTTISGGNLSVRDSEGNIWVSPSGGDKAALPRKDVCKIFPDGTVDPGKKPSLEYLIHQEILRVRPDLQAVLHAHPPALVAMSLLRKTPELHILMDLQDLCGEVKIATYGLPGSKELQENVSAVFKTGCNVVILENHGVFIGSSIGIFHAYKIFDTLEFLARMQLQAPVFNGQEARVLSDEQLRQFGEWKRRTLEESEQESASNIELLLREEICRMTKRSLKKQLFNSTQGVFSARIDENSFVILPQGKDNAFLEPEDLVRVSGGKREAGKHPHYMASLHRLIYDCNPEIHSIVTAIPPAAGTFAVTDQEYDVKLIPECYNRLRETKKFSFDTLMSRPEEIALYLSLETPVAIIENAFAVIASVSTVDSYDRLEILEFTARSIHFTKTMGYDVVNITEEQAEKLRERFKLPKAKPIVP